MGSRWFAGLVLLLVGAAPALGASPGLQAHRAVYDLKLQANQKDSGVETVQGRLVMEWASVCDGYILNQRLLTRTVDMSGDEQVFDYSVATWESRDGLAFRFNARNSMNGALVEETSGTAKLDGTGERGSASFTKPEKTTLELPAGTIFPTEHTLRLVNAGRRGLGFYGVRLFDGSTTDAVYDTTAAIGAASRAGVEAAGEPGLVAGLTSWPISLAYYPLGRGAPEEGSEGLPEFEIGRRLYENGIAGDVLRDSRDFALGGRLTLLQKLPAGGC